MKTLTVIVPAYNVVETIADTLDSLIYQTKKDLHVIIVNDGSTDNTEQVCLKYRDQYPDFITYIKQENKGLGGARNTGLSHVDTPYVTFLDSDDWYDPRLVEKVDKLLDGLEEEPDMIFTLPICYDVVSKQCYDWMDKQLLMNIFFENSYKSKVKNAILDPRIYGLEVNACRKIYKTDFLLKNNYKFPEKLKWEDILGHFELVHKANRCVAMRNTGFYYRVNTGSSITSGTGKTRLDIIPIFNQLEKNANELDFSMIERAYLIKLYLIYSNWFVETTNQDYIGQLLTSFHDFFQTLKDDDLEFYYNNLSTESIRDRAYVNCFRSDQYMLLADYHSREQAIAQFMPHRTRMDGIKEIFKTHGLFVGMGIVLVRIKRRILKQYKVVNGEIVYE